jgi:membrane fusion protein (multidrug efflux system)
VIGTSGINLGVFTSRDRLFLNDAGRRISHFQGCILILILPLLFSGLGCHKEPAPRASPPEVLVLSLSPTNVPIVEEWIGTLDGDVNAQIRAQVSGYLLTQNYAEGTPLRKGDLMFQIDPRPFQAVLDQARARLAQDQATLEKNRQDVERYTPLAKVQAISRQELDTAIQATLASEAQIKADEAAIETAMLNLSFTRITSPIDGLAGVAQGQLGDLVSSSSGVLARVSSINPIKVYFQVSEQSYLNFWRYYAAPEDNSNHPPLQLEMILSDGSVYPEKGQFAFASRAVNIGTGTLQITGLFPNPKLIIRPGQYARVRAQTLTRTNALLVPQRAVTQLQGSYQVAVVGQSNKVSLRPVKVGEQIGSQWIVEQGLKPGERVIVEGSQKAKEGAQVNPQPFIAAPHIASK